MIELVTICRALSDATRLRIVFSLSQEPKNVKTLCKELRLRQPTASHHLGILRAVRLVAPRRAGKEVFYGLHEDAVTASETKANSVLEVTGEDGTVRIAWRK